MRDAWSDLETRGEIFGVSVDSEKSHEKFISKYQLPFPLLSDPDHAIVEAYGVWVEKSMYGKKYMGAERSTFVIDSRRPPLSDLPQSEAGRARRSIAERPAALADNPKIGVAVAPIRCLHCAPQNAELLTHLYGIPEEAPEGENLQAQAPQAHEGESPQEAFALQVVTAPRVSSAPSSHLALREVG